MGVRGRGPPEIREWIQITKRVSTLPRMALCKRYRVASLLLSDSAPVIPQPWFQEWKALGSIIRRRVSVRLVQSHVASP